MTIYTCKLLDLIAHKSYTVFRLRKMTFVTGDLGMSTLQGKGGSVVVKKVGRPPVEAMTPLAIRRSVLVKLGPMYILMTSCTG